MSLEHLRGLDDRLFLRPKVLYFSISLVFYTFFLYRAGFMENYLGLNKLQYGDLSAMMSVAGFVGTAGWSWVADRLRCHRFVLCLLVVLIALLLETLPWVRPLAPDVRYYLDWLILGFYGFFSAALLPLVDYLVMEMLADRPGFNKELYGRQVLFGTIAYGVAAFGVGPLIKAFSDLTIIIQIQRVTSAIGLIATLLCVPADRRPKRMPPEGAIEMHGKSADRVAPPDETRPSPLQSLLFNANFLFMIIAVFLTGSARSIMTLFLPKYWEDHLGLDEVQISVAANSGIVFELLVFIVGTWCVRKMGVYWLLLAGQAFAVARTWTYVLFPNASPWGVYAIELLKGATFGFTQLSGTKIAVDSAPPGLQATALAVYGAVYSQLPSVVTAIVGGRCLHESTPAVLFKGTAYMITPSLVLCTLKYAIDGSIKLFQR